jgi:hypothetical protein
MKTITIPTPRESSITELKQVGGGAGSGIVVPIKVKHNL